MSGSFRTFNWILVCIGTFIFFQLENGVTATTVNSLSQTNENFTTPASDNTSFSSHVSLATTDMSTSPNDMSTSTNNMSTSPNDMSTSHSTTDNTSQIPDDGKPPEVESSSGLSPGAAAGVAVGTIAGVAVLGGGIFAGLKFSGRLSG